MTSLLNTALLKVIEGLEKYLKPHHKPDLCMPEDLCISCKVNHQLLLICDDLWEPEGTSLEERVETLLLAGLEEEPMRKEILQSCKDKIDDLLSTFEPGV